MKRKILKEIEGLEDDIENLEIFHGINKMMDNKVGMFKIRKDMGRKRSQLEELEKELKELLK